MRRLVPIACAAALAGCGGSPAPRPAPTPQEVVFFQRQGAGGATLDTIRVRDDGSVELQKRYGGAGGKFRDYALRDGVLERIRGTLEKLPDGSSLTRGSPPPGGAQYLLRYEGRTLTGREGGLVPAARPAIALLDDVMDGARATTMAAAPPR